VNTVAFLKNFIPVGKIAKKQSEGVPFVLIRHSNYCAILSKMHCFFGNFAHWVILKKVSLGGHHGNDNGNI